MKELKERLDHLIKKIEEAFLIIRLKEDKSQLQNLEKKASCVGFWESPEATGVMQEISFLKDKIFTWGNLLKEAEDLLTLLEITKEKEHLLYKEIEEKTKALEEKYESLEFHLLLGEEFDKNNALLSVYAGSGGVEASDWAEMLLSMYLKFARLKNFESKILNISPGEEAGIKSVTLEIKGPYAFGYLKSEKGVHRLVRISPFDADHARHTSFALVEVLPEIEKEAVKINKEDLKIETFRARGHGGQSVNTTDSAVRITHLPTGITVSCQNERSQLQNKEMALKILQSRLYQYLKEKRKDLLTDLRGGPISAEWGNQIRSYVLHPYKLIKDHRTNYESKEPDKVLAGEIDGFIDAFLRWQAEKRN